LRGEDWTKLIKHPFAAQVSLVVVLTGCVTASIMISPLHPAVGCSIRAETLNVTSILNTDLALAPSAPRETRAGMPGASSGALWIVFAAYTVAYLVWNASGRGLDTHVGRWVDALAYLPLNLAAVVGLTVAAARGHFTPRQAHSLRLLALMYALTIAGNIALGFDAIERGRRAADSIGNTFIVASYVVAIVALLRFPIAPLTPADRRSIPVDAACVLVSMGALTWTFVLAPVSWATITPGSVALNLMYPASCVIVLTLLCRILLQQTSSAQRRDVLLLATALFAQVTFDMLLSVDYTTAPIASSRWVLLIYPFTYVVIIRACELAVHRGETTAPPSSELALHPVRLLPTVCAMSVYCVLIWAALSELRQPLAVLVSCAIMLNVLFLFKQASTVRENLMLQSARADAESRARFADLIREGQKLESVGRLAGGVAHDFNNLLTTVLANSDFALSRMPPGTPGHDEVTDIRGAAMRGAELIRQLLAFSRKSVIAPVRLQPDLVLRDMERLLQRLAGERHALTLDLATDLGLVLVDRGQLEQVLANLVTNARDAMPDGGPIVIAGRNVRMDPSAASELSLPAGEYIALSVQDSGAGIAPEVRAHIFEPFFSTKERGKGTGLGLASSYGIMRQSNGGIAVESDLGRGSRFTLYFPRVHAAATPTSALAKTPARIPNAPHHQRAETVLLVEDEAVVRQVTRRMLASEGYNVLTAANADAARALFDAHGDAISLMITDVVMPGDSGLTLAAALRSRSPDVSVIFISGYPDAELPEGVKPNTRDDFLQKPFTGAQLLARVESRLTARRRPFPTGAHSP
jgi:signal transduction histidine kinase/ActR/RegA family two-component response regulator